ncbi:MAG: cytochrome c3 family protein [Acidobacteria bacterium]|nr:cytochrome c3 family protein [Acidobacteriota bacterium]
MQDLKALFREMQRREIVLAGLVGVVFFVGALVWPFAPSGPQPIQYNHQKHLQAGLECSTCHTLYENSAFAGLPQLDTCSTCHQEALTQSREESKLLEMIQQEKPLDWEQINKVPDHVYFSHKTHAVDREIGCATCHGEMKERTTPPTRPFIAWTMSNCINCHKQQNATVDCNGCHR